MAENAVIGALRVVLGADTGQLEDGLKRGSDSLKSFARDAAAVATGVGLEKFVEKVAESFTHLIKQSVETADQMNKMSQKVGTSVESLSGLVVSATLSDLSIEELGKSMGKLNKQMVAAAAGGTNEAAAAIQYLGLSAKQLVAAGPDVALQKIADKFAVMANGANKSAVAIALFGRAGINLIPLLNQGGKSIQEMTRTAQELGLVISTQTAKQSEGFMDNLKLLGLAVQGVGLTVLKYFVPGMEKASQSMVKWVVDGKLVSGTAEVIVRAITFVTDNLKIFGIALAVVFGGQILKSIAAVGLMFVQLGISILSSAAATVILGARMIILLGSIALVAGAVLLLTGNLDKFFVWVEKLSESALPGLKDASEGAKATLKAMGFDIGALEKNIGDLTNGSHDVEKAIKDAFNGKNFDPNAAKEAKKFGDEILKIQLKTRELKGDFDTLAPGFIAAAEKMKLIKDNAVGFNAALVALNPQMMILNTELLKQAAANITQDNLTPWQNFEKQMVRINQVVGIEGGISWDTWARASMKAMDSAGVSMSKMSDDMIGGWKDLFQALGKENEQFFKMGQALAIVMAVINTAEGVTKALAQGGFLGFAMAAAVAAKGLAQIITIKQQKFSKAAAGGSFKVPGGSMGVDTRLIPMALAPGERVDVTPASKTGGDGGRYMDIPAIRPDEFFRGDTVRAMVDAFDKWMRDGGTGIRMVPR